jgi:carbonic anhydrase
MVKLACVVVPLLLFLFFLKQSSQSTLTLMGANSGFCYEKGSWCGPESDKWSGSCKTGQNQSPIDVPHNSTTNERAAKIRSLFFNSEYRAPDFYIRNNGHSIQVSFSPDLTSNAEMSGYGLENPYIFAQLHFHWGSENQVGGSEHTINGKQLPAEAHFVHYNSKYASFQAAIDSGNKLL